MCVSVCKCVHVQIYLIPLLYAYAIKCVLIYCTYSYTCIQYTYNKIVYIACLIQFICHIYLTWICNCASIAHMFFLTPNVLCSFVFLWGREMLRQSILMEGDGKSTKLRLNDLPFGRLAFLMAFFEAPAPFWNLRKKTVSSPNKMTRLRYPMFLGG